MIEELIIIVSILATGILLLKLLGLKGWGVLPLGFLTGFSVFAVIINSLIFLDWPVTYWLPVGIVPPVMLVLYLWQQRSSRPHLNKKSLLIYSTVALACLAVFWIVWSVNIAVYATDTLRQSLASSLIAAGNSEFMSNNLMIKRLNAVSLVDALGFLYGSPYIRTLPIFISLATAGSIAWSIGHLLRGKLARRKQHIGVGLIGAMLFASTYSVWWQSFYQGTHILYGGLLLLAVLSGWLLIRGNHPGASKASLVAIIITAIFGLMLSRPESGILVTVALLPLLLHPSITVRIKRYITAALGLSILFQQATIIFLSLQIANPIPKNAILLAATGVLLLLLIFAVQLKYLSTHWRYILWAVEIAGWLALLVFTLYEPTIMWKSTVGTIKNIVFGQGLWGISYAILIILLGLSALLKKGDRLDILLRYPITTLLPYGFLVGYLRDGAYRAGAYDTFNRMLMHVLPLLIVYLVYRYYAAALSRQPKSRRPSN